MKKLSSTRLLAVIVFAATLAATAAMAQEIVTAEAQATAILKRMANYLAQARHFSVTIDTGFDAVQDFGQKIEFGETRTVLVSRPDRLRVDVTKRAGAKSMLVFDGKDIGLYFAKENVYAIEPKPGTLDDAIEYFVNDLDMRLPLAEMLSSRVGDVLPGLVRSAAYAEKSYVAGVACDHVAFRGDDADLQLWVAQGDKPLPQRVVITYTRLDGRPQFWAQFSSWNLAPHISSSSFVFKPPAGAAKIQFARKLAQQHGGDMSKEGN